jgi:hypothetical protein
VAQVGVFVLGGSIFLRIGTAGADRFRARLSEEFSLRALFMAQA